jgi:hypothetical protein
MPGSLQNRFTGHEEMPPPTVWNKISGRLDEEFSSSDSALSARMEKVSMPPPAAAFNNILSELRTTVDVPVQEPAKVIPIFYKRLAIAVILAAVMAVGAMYLFTGSNVKSTFTRPVSVTAGKKTVPAEDSSQPLLQQPVASTDANVKEKILIASNQRSPSSQLSERNNSNDDQDYLTAELTESHSTPLEPVNALQPISVSAPLIRDSRGNIIMDLRLLTKPGQPYVTVTGPNGNQTRISNKFLNCLSYINGNNNSAEMDDAANECKEKFAEWRNKLLSEAAFIPAANNFFDIFELKEMIQD